MKILVIDDSRPTRRLVAELLASLGHECLEAADGLEGLVALLEHGDLDVVLLDREMPNLDGIGFLERLGDLVPDRPPVIVISSRNEPELTLEALDAGASAFLAKPFDAASLRDHLERVTGSR